jgi:hypothetical protein
MRKKCFSARQNAENEHPLKLKDQVRNWRFLKHRFPECDCLFFSLCGKPLKVKTLSSNSIKKKRMWKLFLHTEQVFKQNEDVSNEHVCYIQLGKKRSFYIFHIFPHIRKNSKCFSH